MGVRSLEAMECEGQCLNGGVCNNGVCQCGKKYSGSVCQFEMEEEERSLDLDQGSGVFTFYLLLLVLIIVIGGTAFYVLKGKSAPRSVNDQDDGRIIAPNDGLPGSSNRFD